MRILPISILMALTIWGSAAFSDSPAEPAFLQGLESYKVSNFTQSREQFTSLLAQHPNDPILLYNLGLVELNDKHPGKALAYWRKALYLQPGFSPALSGIRQVHRVFPNLRTPESDFMNMIYWRLPLWFFAAAGFIFFVFSGILWVLYASRRKRQQAAGMGGPIFSSLLFVGFITLTAYGYFSYYSIPRATVLESPLAVLSSPAEGAPSLVDFSEGDEVRVLREQDQWLQVQKSATALGWVPKEKVLVHSGF